VRIRPGHIDDYYLPNGVAGEVRKAVDRERFVDQYLEDGAVFF
jgi:hypothetical protein